MPTMLTSAGAAVLIAGAVAAAAAPGGTRLFDEPAAVLRSARQVRPGEPTRGEVWIMNRDAEPIPVVVRDVVTDTPLRVRVVPPAWQYQTVLIKNGGEAARVLSSVGADGWEATGVTWPADGGTLVLMKKPR
jgi:hypothetical protein